MSSEERDIILQMVAEGKLSTAEAADLLDALNASEAEEGNSAAPDWGGADFGSAVAAEVAERFGTRWQEREMRRRERDMRRMERDMERMARDQERDLRRGNRGSGRSLLIHVTDGSESKVHVRIPIGMALAAGKFLPKKARSYFEEYGIDLSDLMDSVSNDQSRSGELINIQDGDTRVLVSIIGSDSYSGPAVSVSGQHAPHVTPPIPPIPPAPPAPPVAPEPAVESR